MRWLLGGVLAAYYVIRRTEGQEKADEFAGEVWSGFTHGVYLLFFSGMIALWIYNTFIR